MPLVEAHEPVPSQPFVLFFEDEDEELLEAPLELELDVGPLSVRLSQPALESEPESETEPQSAPEAPALLQFEAALTAALMAKGASRAAALVPRLLRLEALPPDSLSKEARLTLQSRGYVDGNLRYSQKYRELCGAWCAVLRGSSQDFGACGTTTLDRFGAELLAALLAVPITRADELRRELRKAGVAAFGVLLAA